MFKKFNWGLTRPFLFRWPITGFSSVRTDYGLIVKANSVIVKVLESVFFKKFKKFNKTITLSHILIKHINVPKYISTNNSVITEANIKKVKKFKLKFKTKKFKPKRKKLKSLNLLNLSKQKNNKIIVEIFYNFFSRNKYKKHPYHYKRYSRRFKLKKTKKTKKRKQKQKRAYERVVLKNIFKIARLNRYTYKYSRSLTRYLSRKRVKKYYNKPIIRSPYLFKMADIAFSFYNKKIVKVKPVKKFRGKLRKFLKLKTKKFKHKLKYIEPEFKPVKTRVKFLIQRSFQKLYWKAFAVRLQKSFTRFNLNIFPVFREINILHANASFYANYLIKRLRASKRPQIFQAVNPLIKQLKKSTRVLGVKIKFKGRFTRNQRATKKNISFGSLPYGSINQKVDYSLRVFNAKFGSTSIKFLIKFAK